MTNINHSAILFILMSLLYFGCAEHEVPKENDDVEYLRWVGDIEQDASQDNINFNICNGDDQIIQYFNAGKGPVYAGGKPQIIDKFEAEFVPIQSKQQNGFIRIRFIVNCQGKAGRFRLLQSDFNYTETAFDEKIISQLLEITKGIDEWVILYQNNQPADYYYYLHFKIDDGSITEILP